LNGEKTCRKVGGGQFLRKNKQRKKGTGDPLHEVRRVKGGKGKLNKQGKKRQKVPGGRAFLVGGTTGAKFFWGTVKSQKTREFGLLGAEGGHAKKGGNLGPVKKKIIWGVMKGGPVRKKGPQVHRNIKSQEKEAWGSLGGPDYQIWTKGRELVGAALDHT